MKMKLSMPIIAVALLYCGYANAQVRRMPKVSKTFRAGTVRPNMKIIKPLQYSVYKNSALYKARQQRYHSSYTNPKHTYSFPDGSKMTINLLKNPSFEGMSNSIQPSVSTGTPVHGGTQPGWACSNSHITVNAKTTDFGVADYSLQEPHIYPGAIYTASGYLTGSFQTPGGARHPIVIATDNPNVQGTTYIQVVNPSQSTIQNAIAQLSNRLSGSGNGSTEYNYYESYNTSDWTIKVSAGGSGFGASLNNDYNNSNKQYHRYITIDVTKELYSMYTNPPDNGFYANAATESTPDLIVIGEVTYGIRILANLDITFTTSAAADDFMAHMSYDGFSGNLGVNYLQNNSSNITSINAYEIGGPNTGAVAIDKNTLVNSINNILQGANYHNARPIKYQLYDMAWDPVGAESATDQFNYTSCVPVASPQVLKSVNVSISTGSDGKDHDTHFAYSLFNSAGQSSASYINNSNNSEWPSNSSNINEPLAVSGSHPLSEFINGSCLLRMQIWPNGHDTIKMNWIKVTLNFNNQNGNEPKTDILQWNNVILNQDGTIANLNFSYINGQFVAQ